MLGICTKGKSKALGGQQDFLLGALYPVILTDALPPKTSAYEPGPGQRAQNEADSVFACPCLNEQLLKFCSPGTLLPSP